MGNVLTIRQSINESFCHVDFAIYALSIFPFPRVRPFFEVQCSRNEQGFADKSRTMAHTAKY